MIKNIFLLTGAILSVMFGQHPVSSQLTTPSPLIPLLQQNSAPATASGLDNLLTYTPQTLQTIDAKQVANTLMTPFEYIVSDLNKTIDNFTMNKISDLNKFINTTMVGFKDSGGKFGVWLKQKQELYIGGGLTTVNECIKNALSWFANCKIQHVHDSFDIIGQLFAGNTKNLGCFAINVGTKAMGSGNVLTNISDGLNKMLMSIKGFLGA